jgi:hypothetical protein
VTATARYRQTPGIVCRRIAEEVVLVPVEGELAHDQVLFFLDPVGEFVWQRLEGVDLEALVGEVTAAFDVDEVTARDDLSVFVNDLAARGLATTKPDADEQ